MNCGVPDNAGNCTFFAKNGNSSAASDGGIGATYAVEPEKPLVVDVLDNVADFIGMSRQHDDLISLAGQGGPSGAVSIALDGGGVFLNPIRPDFLAWHFESGRAGSFQQTMEKFLIFFFHGVDSNSDVPVDKRIE